MWIRVATLVRRDLAKVCTVPVLLLAPVLLFFFAVIIYILGIRCIRMDLVVNPRGILNICLLSIRAITNSSPRQGSDTACRTNAHYYAMWHSRIINKNVFFLVCVCTWNRNWDIYFFSSPYFSKGFLSLYGTRRTTQSQSTLPRHWAIEQKNHQLQQQRRR